MRKLLIILFTLASFYATADADRAGCFDSPIFQLGNDLGGYLIVDDFINYIPWDIGAEPPPLSMFDATQLVQNWFNKQSKAEAFNVESNSLKTFPCIVNEQYKAIRLYVLVLSSPRQLIAVTMNGRIISLEPIH